jgi:hypothetical protein
MAYSVALDHSVATVAASKYCATPNYSRSKVLEACGDGPDGAGGPLLQGYYLGIFLCAEMAFVIMALREYVYEELGLSEGEVLRGRVIGPSKTS